jgi:hypothetical protein
MRLIGRMIKSTITSVAITAWTLMSAFGCWYAHELFNHAQPYVNTLQRFEELNKQIPSWGLK